MHRDDLQVCVHGGWECLASRCLGAGLKVTERVWNAFVLSPGHLGLKLPAQGGEYGWVSVRGEVHSLAYPMNIRSTQGLATHLVPPPSWNCIQEKDSTKQDTLLTSHTEEKKGSSGLGLTAVESYCD